MTEIDISQLGWLLGLAGIAFGIWGQLRGGRQETEKSAREMATILAELRTLGRQVEQLQMQVQGFNGCIVDMATRLGAVEKTADRAHIRIDKVEDLMRRAGDEPRIGA